MPGQMAGGEMTTLLPEVASTVYTLRQNADDFYG